MTHDRSVAVDTSLTDDSSREIAVTLVGGPTTIIEIGGLRLVTDPTFDAPGVYPIGSRELRKTTGPAIPLTDIGEINAVLLSHDQHADNLDTSGRQLLSTSPLTVSTCAAAERLGPGVTALAPWDALELARPDGQVLTITAVPARHGPAGTEHLTGEVIGFVLSGIDVPTVYVSGDNASLDIVRTIAARYSLDAAVLFAGAARTPLIDGFLTLTSEEAAAAATILAVPVVVVHVDGWQHFTEGPTSVEDAFVNAGLAQTLVAYRPGDKARITVH